MAHLLAAGLLAADRGDCSSDYSRHKRESDERHAMPSRETGRLEELEGIFARGLRDVHPGF
jgi:hypothetical protein